VESARVCVIDSSATIRETIAIVLGGDHEVRCLTADDFLRDPGGARDADLLIIADNALSADSLPLLPRGRPVLWLQSHAGAPPPSVGQRASIPRWFSPEDLRTMVRSLLAEPAAAQLPFDSLSGLEYPIVPQDVAQLARRAAATRLPVLICGEPGTGKARLARAIHAAGQQGRFVQLADTTCTRHALEQAGSVSPGSLTIFVHDLGRVPSDGQQLLLELLDCGGFSSTAGWHAVRLICGTSLSFSDLARAQTLDRDVFYRLSVLPLNLQPLRERSHDIPALVASIASDIAHTLGTEPVNFSGRAIERLIHYLWFGNLAELETVLTRTIALAASRSIEADDLLFGYGRIAPRQREASVARAPHAGAAASVGTTSVDLIINELAHEFKNPMVTIKTIAQHMERMLADQEGRQDVARLTGDAVDRMDRVLENLLQFTRFRAPAPSDVGLAALLAPCLLNLTPTLSERRVTLDYRPPSTQAAFVDAEQVEYALDNLLRAIARDLQDGQTLSIRSLGSTPVLAFEYPSTGHSFAGTLSNLLDDTGPDGGDALPLGLVLAKTLIERNGGHLETRASAPLASVTVWLPSREELAAGNGKTTNLSS
jgi:transcriptional regulator with AAA-type ATPase domain